MALFDKFLGKSASSSPLSLQEVTSGVLLSVIGSDGHISNEEVDFFVLVANRHPIFRDQPASDFNKMIDKMQGILKREGWKSLVQRCGADSPPEFNSTIFALAVDFVLADGSVEQEEREIVGYLQGVFGVPDQVAGQIVESLAIKNGVL